MIGVTFTAAARSDLRDIALRIAEYSFRRSISYVDEIETRCRGIADFPRSGAPRPQWGTDTDDRARQISDHLSAARR